MIPASFNFLKYKLEKYVYNDALLIYLNRFLRDTYFFVEIKIIDPNSPDFKNPFSVKRGTFWDFQADDVRV